MDLGSMYYVARIRFHSHYLLIVILAILVAMHTTTTWSTFSISRRRDADIHVCPRKSCLALPSVDLQYKKKMILESANLRIRYYYTILNMQKKSALLKVKNKYNKNKSRPLPLIRLWCQLCQNQSNLIELAPQCEI